MSCNCKNKNEVNVPFVNNDNKTPKESLAKLIPIYFVKLLGFTVGLILLPIIMCAIIVFMFRTIVMTREIDVKPLFNSAFKMMKNANEENNDDDEEEEEDNPDDIIEYVMEDVEDITNK
jgi:hypothetical protein